MIHDRSANATAKHAGTPAKHLHSMIPPVYAKYPVFWMILAYFGLCPTSLDRTVSLFSFIDFPLKVSELLIVFGAVFYGLVFFLSRKHTLSRHRKRDRLILLLVLVYCYSGISFLWGHYSGDELPKMLVQYVLVVSTFAFAWFFIMGLDEEYVFPMIAHIALFVFFCTFVYAFQTVTGLGFGANREVIDMNFGIRRLAGPLYTASTGHFLLLPAIALVYCHFFRKPVIVTLSTFLFTFSIILLGSRSGILLALIFFFVILVYKIPKKLFFVSFFFISIVLAILLFLLLHGQTDRFQSLDDTYRTDAVEVVMKSLEQRDGLNILFGDGYGTIWNWRSTLHEILLGNTADERFANFFIMTPYGRTTFHPHSLFLYSFVEIGVIGLLFWVLFMAVLFKRAASSYQNHTTEYLAFLYAVIFVSFLLNFLDLMIMTNLTTSIVWLFFLLGVIRMTCMTNQNTGNAVTAPPFPRKS